MTVSATDPYVAYAGAGTSGPFAIPFRFLANADLVVTKVVGGVEATITGNTITGADATDGGELYTAAPVAVGETLRIYRDTARTQTAQYVANGPFPAATHERALDKLMLVSQEQDRELQRAVMAPLGEAGPPIPSIADRKGFIAFWDTVTGAWTTFAGTLTGVAASAFGQVLVGTANAEAGRSALGGNGQLSLGDVPFDLDPAVNRAAYQSIAQRCADEGKTLWIPKGTGLIDGTIDVAGVFDIAGPGTLRTTGFDGPIIRMTITGLGAYRYGPTIRDVSFFNDTTALNRGSSAIEFAGTGTLILYPQFINLTSEGCYALIRNKCLTFSGPFGDENYINWGTMQSCRVYNHPLGVNARHMLLCERGSGTGWALRDCKGEIAFPAGAYGTELVGLPAYARFDGLAGDVVGDILFDGHITGLNAACMSINGGLNYLVNISIGPSTQIDATARHAIYYDPPAPAIYGNAVRASNLGGSRNIAKGLPADLRGSRLESYGFHEATGGSYGGPYSASLQTINVCRIHMAPYHTTECTVWASGIVEGVNYGMRKAVFSVRMNATTAAATEQAGLGFVDPAAPGAGFFTFDSLAVGNLVTIRLKFTPAAPGGSDVAWQYRGEAGACRYEAGDSTP